MVHAIWVNDFENPMGNLPSELKLAWEVVIEGLRARSS